MEDEEDEFVRTPVNDKKGRGPSDKDTKPPKTVKKATKSAEPSRSNGKSWQARTDDNDATPPAPSQAPKRRKSGVDQDYYEPDRDAYNWQSLESANVRQRPPSRRKSIRELRESDFEYREEEDEEETDADELNLRVGFTFHGLFPDTWLSLTCTLLQRSFEGDGHPEKPAKQQRTTEAPPNPRKNGRKRKAVDAMDVDEPVVSGRGAGKAVKTR